MAITRKFITVTSETTAATFYFVYHTPTHYVLGADVTGTYDPARSYNGNLIYLFSVYLNPEEQNFRLARYAYCRPWPSDSDAKKMNQNALIEQADRLSELVSVATIEREATPADTCFYSSNTHLAEASRTGICLCSRATGAKEMVYEGEPSTDIAFPLAPAPEGHHIEDMFFKSKQEWAAAGFPLASSEPYEGFDDM